MQTIHQQLDQLRRHVSALQVSIGPRRHLPPGTECTRELLKLDLEYVDSWLRHAQVDARRAGLGPVITLPPPAPAGDSASVNPSAA